MDTFEIGDRVSYDGKAGTVMCVGAGHHEYQVRLDSAGAIWIGDSRLTAVITPYARERIAELEAALQEAYGTAATFNAEAIQARARIAELESAVQHADKVVEQLTAERDAALERAEKAEEKLSALRDWSQKTYDDRGHHERFRAAAWAVYNTVK